MHVTHISQKVTNILFVKTKEFQDKDASSKGFYNKYMDSKVILLIF